MRFWNLPERSKLLTCWRHCAFTTTCSTNQIKSRRKATVAFYRGQIALSSWCDNLRTGNVDGGDAFYFLHGESTTLGDLDLAIIPFIVPNNADSASNKKRGRGLVACAGQYYEQNISYINDTHTYLHKYDYPRWYQCERGGRELPERAGQWYIYHMSWSNKRCIYTTNV